MNADEFSHTIKQLAQQQVPDFRPMVYAHIATYDPAGHRVRVVIPSLRDDDPSPTLSGWMPLASMSIGAGYGVQTAPFGGATLTDPTGGEQVLVGIMDHKRGVCACMGMTYNGVMQPPATVLEQPLLPGETVIFNKTGSFWRMHANGDIESNAQGNIIMTATQSMSFTAPAGMTFTTPVATFTGNINGGSGTTGSFTSGDGSTVMVENGSIVNID